jgi:hypothetical protein
MQILTINNWNFQKLSWNPSNRTKVKILKTKFWIAHQNVRTSKLLCFFKGWLRVYYGLDLRFSKKRKVRGAKQLECWVIWKVADPPPPCDWWRTILAGHFGDSPRGRGHFLPPLGGGGGGFGCPIEGFPQTQAHIVFCLVLLIYITSRLCFLMLYSPLDTALLLVLMLRLWLRIFFLSNWPFRLYRGTVALPELSVSLSFAQFAQEKV